MKTIRRKYTVFKKKSSYRNKNVGIKSGLRGGQFIKYPNNTYERCTSKNIFVFF